jgi:hypothetical protein
MSRRRDAVARGTAHPEELDASYPGDGVPTLAVKAQLHGWPPDRCVPSKGLVHCAANRRPTEDAAIAEWADKPNYFDVVVWASLGSENAGAT